MKSIAEDETLSTNDYRASIFAGKLKELMVISYVVLGNNVVTGRFIEKRYRMPIQAWSSLYVVREFPGIRAKEIREVIPRPQNTISRAVSLLEARGYLRQEVSETDGREKCLYVTPAGAKLVDELVEISRLRQEEWLAPLTPNERTMFYQLSRKIAEGHKLLTTEVMSVD